MPAFNLCWGYFGLRVSVFLTVFGSVCLMTMSPPPVGSWNRAPVSLVQNGYRGLVLAIADSVPEDPELIEKIKTLFTEASTFLYQATNHRAYFHELTILVPETWADSPTYQPARTESFQAANVIVNTVADHDIPADPFVKQPGMCGEEGAYLHLTSELIGEGNDGPWGNLSRVLVHEWGHLRWGLFDEYPSGPDDQHFYLNGTGGVEPIRCSKAVSGDVVPYQAPGEALTPEIRCEVGENVGHLPDRRCRFQPHRQQAQGATGSLMYSHYADQITGFCHSNGNGDAASLHNAEAPNRHNALCGGRSAWDVMLSTADFAKGANPPREGAPTLPQFAVKRRPKMRVVLVLDTSSTMNDNRKLRKLRRASAYYLTNVLPKDSWVGLVQFNTTATVLAPLTKIRYESSRQRLVERLPTAAGGGASMGAGILKAVEVLSANGESPQRSIILVISDGLEDTPPSFNDVRDDVMAKGVILDAMAYSHDMSENFHLPGAGGGGSYFIPFAENDTMVTEEPVQLEDEEFRDTENFQTIVRRSKMLSSGGNGTDYVHIDGTVGKDTVFRFIWEIGQATAVVRRPNGSLLDPSSPEYSMDMEGRKVEIKIPGTAEPGQWGYGILNMNDDPQIMRVHVYSAQSDPAVPPLQARATIRRNQLNFTEEQRVVIYGEVTQGELPVIRSKVKALVRRPEDTSSYVVIEMFDLGTGADTVKDDGIYSAYFMEFTGDGVYKVALEVENEVVGRAKKITFPQTLSEVMPPNWNNTKEPVLVDVDPFMRATQAVEFTVVSAPTSDEMNETDMFPPARVTDLKVAGVSRYQGRLTLKWTAPGDDWSRGTAAKYELRCSHSFMEMLSDFSSTMKVNDSDVISGDLSAPQPSGSEETLTLRIPTMLTAQPDLILYLAFRIRAIDDQGLAGEVSNIVSTLVDYGAGPTTTQEVPTTATPPPSSTALLSTITPSVTTVKASNPLEILGRNLAIVLGVSIFLVVFSVVVLIVACRTRRRTKNEEDKSPSVAYSKARSTRRVSDAWVLEEI